jgi:hypothetical protein
MSISRVKNSSHAFEFYSSNGEEFFTESSNKNRLLETFLLESDLYNVATAFYELERAIIQDKKKIIKVIIPLARKTYNIIDREKVSKILNDIALFIFHHSVEFSFKPRDIMYQSKLYDNKIEKYDAVCLFSGGADSLIGVNETKKKYKRVLALYISHCNSHWLTNIISRLRTDFLNKEKIKFEQFIVPPQIKGAYSQTRGLLYIVCGGICSSIYKSHNLILSECGVTMYQPSFGELDKTTFTSHPLIQEKAKELIKAFLGKDVEIITPFENNTKSEMFAIFDKKNILKTTHSCISSRFGRNLGGCYGCLIRRIGLVVAGIKDENYAYDVFTLEDEDKLKKYGKNFKGKHATTEFLELIKFCLDILLDYENMSFTKKKKIDAYGKYDLFRRFSLDTFAALYILFEKENKGTNQSISKAYFDARKYISQQELEERINEVRNLTSR